MAITNPELTRVLVTVHRDTLAAIDAFVEKQNAGERNRRDQGKDPKPILKREHLLTSAILRLAKDIGRKR